MDEEKNSRKSDDQNDADPNATGSLTPGDGRDRQIQELQDRIEELQRSLENSKDQLLRKAAEFDNYRRRAENDFANIIKNANEALISALLPIVNDFARSLAQGKESRGNEGFYKGVELIHAKLLRLLEQQGLTSFDSVGKPFDVEYHDALLQVPRSDVPPHTVVEEVERGYRLHDRVLRHAKVVVSSAPGEDEGALPGDSEDRSGKGK